MKSQSISFLQAIAISLGAMIGWGAFVMPSDLFLRQSNLLGTMLAFLLGTLMVLIVARSYVRLMKKHRLDDGGTLFWVATYLGKNWALSYGVGVLVAYLTIISLNASALMLLLRTFLPNVWQQGFLYQINDWAMYGSELAVAVLALSGFAIVNAKGVHLGAKFQLVISLIMVLSIVLLTALSANNAPNFLPSLPQELPALSDFSWVSILAIVPWAYIGFESTPQLSSHLNTQKSHFVIYIAIGSGLVLYLLVSYLTAVNFAFDYHQIRQNPWATGVGIQQKIGAVGTWILSLAMMTAILSGINGFMLSAVKLLNALANFLPNHQNRKNHKPHHAKALFAIVMICTIMLLLGRNHLLTLVQFAALIIAISFVYVALTNIIAQKHQTKKDPMSYLSLFMAVGFVGLILFVN